MKNSVQSNAIDHNATGSVRPSELVLSATLYGIFIHTELSGPNGRRTGQSTSSLNLVRNSNDHPPVG